MNFVRRGVLSLFNAVTNEWTSHVFVLLSDRLCYLLENCESSLSNGIVLKREDSLGSTLDEDGQVICKIFMIMTMKRFS